MGVFTSWQPFSSISVLLGDRQGRRMGWRWKRWNKEPIMQTSMWNVNCALTEQHVKVWQTRRDFFFQRKTRKERKTDFRPFSLVSIRYIYIIHYIYINPHRHDGAPGFPAVVGKEACCTQTVTVSAEVTMEWWKCPRTRMGNNFTGHVCVRARAIEADCLSVIKVADVFRLSQILELQPTVHLKLFNK